MLWPLATVQLQPWFSAAAVAVAVAVAAGVAVFTVVAVRKCFHFCQGHLVFPLTPNASHVIRDTKTAGHVRAEIDTATRRHSRLGGRSFRFRNAVTFLWRHPAPTPRLVAAKSGGYSNRRRQCWW